MLWFEDTKEVGAHYTTYNYRQQERVQLYLLIKVYKEHKSIIHVLLSLPKPVIDHIHTRIFSKIGG